jgi:phage terminase small subunit
MALTEKHERFCEEYQLDLNATQAATRAGYSAKTARITGQRLLAREDVQERLREMRRRRAERTQVEADQVLLRLQDVAEKCMTEVPTRDADGEEVGTRMVNASGAIRALELLGKHLGLFVDRQQIVSDQETTISLEWTTHDPVKLRQPDSGGPLGAETGGEGVDLE